MTDPSVSPRRLPYWLTVSLLVNLLLLGLIAGLALRSGSQGDRGEGHHKFGSDLSQEDRRAMFRLMRVSLQETESERQVRDEARKELGDVLSDEPYDPEAVREAFGKLRVADESVHAAAHEAMILRLGALPAEQRAVIADVLAKGPRGRKHQKD